MSLHVSSAPHVHSKDSTQTIMRDVLIAMLPTTVMGVYCFGFNAALLCVLGVAAAVLAEYGYQKMTRQRVRTGDLSAAVTGLLVALNLPGNAPLVDARGRQLHSHSAGQAALRRHRR